MDEIPQRIRDFLFEYIHSHEELEVLVLMHRERAPGRSFTAENIADLLKITVNLVHDALKPLTERGIVEALTVGPSVHYVTSEHYEKELDELVALYRLHRLEIVMLMGANAIERVRTGAMRTFADCFFVRKKRKDG